MLALIQTIDLALGIYWWIIIGSAIFSWLYAFNVVNPRNQFVGMIGNFLYRATEPALAPIRRFPTTGITGTTAPAVLFPVGPTSSTASLRAPSRSVARRNSTE